MADEKKKKRNKKKKNKQAKHAEDAVAGGEAASADRNHVENDRIAQNGGGQDADVSLLNHHDNAFAAAAATEVEKDMSLTSRDGLEERIKQLEEITASYVQKEAVLEEKIKQLQDENGLHRQKEEKLEETIVQLRKEKDMLTQEKSSLVNKMRQLLDERSAFTLKEASLEEKLGQLEQDRECWLAKNKLSKETISSLENEITRLRAQVVELEESKSYILQQNQSLIENVSDLQLGLKSHEGNIPSANVSVELKKGASKEELNAQIEAACALVEKLITENTELVEKVNELCIKLNQQSMSHASTGNDSLPEAAATETTKGADVGSLPSDIIPAVVQKSESLDDIPIDDEVTQSDSTRDMEPASTNTNSQEAESGETVPVSLGANGKMDMESQVGEGDDKEGVPLTDAPLIGAPFRLVSFVARYVSGADLVEKKPLISRY